MFTPQRLISKAVEIANHPSVNRIEGAELASVWESVEQTRHARDRSVVKTQPLRLDCSCLGSGNLVLVLPSVEWQLGTEMALQLNQLVYYTRYITHYIDSDVTYQPGAGVIVIRVGTSEHQKFSLGQACLGYVWLSGRVGGVDSDQSLSETSANTQRTSAWRPRSCQHFYGRELDEGYQDSFRFAALATVFSRDPHKSLLCTA
ncbi:hypothetical protein CSKR_108284 [Clonorchis sinensis]|uniref:Uncharacterized protein n=1 Tax=Clonorchis sinensis TaxID=79923 RepID=A0A419Q1G9_CLOSI|nr:hypothetical protein CSKR_108284 [Clonorchis sinensis]